MRHYWCWLAIHAVYKFNMSESTPIVCSFASHNSICNLEGTGSQIIPLLACKIDMSSHLKMLGVSTRDNWDEDVSEFDLILNQTGGRFTTANNDEKAIMNVCPKHRKKLTTDWFGRKRSTCCYPTHKGATKSLKKIRWVNASISKEIMQLHEFNAPIGSG